MTASTLPLPEVPQAEVEAAEAERAEAKQERHDNYHQYVTNKPKVQAARAARDSLAAYQVPPGEIERTQALAAQEYELSALASQGYSGFREGDRLIEELHIRRHDAFVAGAERHVARVRQAAEALAEPLAAYFAAWERAADAYGVLERATATVIAARDEASGLWRASDTVRAEAALPECPLPADAASLVRTVLPRPRIYQA
jgi:hypothetical protein